MKFIVSFKSLDNHVIKTQEKKIDEKSLIDACRRAIKMKDKLEGTWDVDEVTDVKSGKKYNIEETYLKHFAKNNPEVMKQLLEERQ